MRPATPLQGATWPLCHLSCIVRWFACALAVAQVILRNQPGLNDEPGLWSLWHRDLHRLIDMAETRMTMLDQPRVVPRITPLDTSNNGTGTP
jgi:hypothetical protein